GQRTLLAHSTRLAERGLRVLMVAEGPADSSLDNPRGLTALGFLGISDPLRPTVKSAVQRCREAGVRVMMITGDHPATARTIGREAGLLDGQGTVLTGTELAELHNGELDQRLEHATVIARATPLDKLRFFFSSRRRHTSLQGDSSSDVCSSDLSFPDASSLKIVRRGTLTCRESGCVMTLKPVEPITIPAADASTTQNVLKNARSEERRVGKECRSGRSAHQ